MCGAAVERQSRCGRCSLGTGGARGVCHDTLSEHTLNLSLPPVFANALNSSVTLSGSISMPQIGRSVPSMGTGAPPGRGWPRESPRLCAGSVDTISVS
jgi:hypothetical protein